MDMRYVTRLDTVENMKRDGAPLSLRPEGVMSWDYPGEDFAFISFVPHWGLKMSFSSSPYSFMEEVFGLTDLYDGMLIYIMDLDNPYYIECAKYIEQFYNEAIEVYGEVPRYLDKDNNQDISAVVSHINKIENYINKKCESNVELRKLYKLSK